MTSISFRDVTLAQAGRVVLADVCLDVGTDEFVSVLGPNGAGKTTLMRAVLGLLPPTRGSIQVFGRPPSRGNPAIGYMPQARGIVGSSRLSGWDFVAAAVNGHRLGLPLLGRAERAEIGRVLELVNATELSHRVLSETSGGEQQRLLIAQALLGRPRLLLLDEPLMNLDPHRQHEVIALVRRLQQELHMTVLFTAHELNPLLAVTDRVLYLGGAQAALGSVDAVISGPVLSRLYGTAIEVVRIGGRIFVMSGSHAIEQDDHRHGSGDDHGHGHGHGTHA